MTGPADQSRQGSRAARAGGLAGRIGGLSPRRRMLGAVVALIVVAAAVAGAVAAAHGGAGSHGPGHVAADLPAQNRPGPVILVPGYGGNTGSLQQLAARIRATGRVATVLHLPGNGTGSLVTDAALLNAAVGTAEAHGAPSVDVIGYSAGGVVALLWARTDDGIAKARRIVTLGSPFHGTRLAAAAEAFLPDACPVACQQLVPDSPLLTSLDLGRAAGLPRWLSLWTTDDQTVVPPDSARLPGAIDVAVQSVCPALRLTHSQLPHDPAVIAMVLQAIGPGPLTHPSPADCGSTPG
jgi:triacylglycerol lipase